MKIAVDFDGTIVEHKYPEIGKIRPFAFETLKMLHNKGHQLILWTYRAGIYLTEAVEFCKANGVEFYAVNSSYPEEMFDGSKSRKIDCDLYIDDRNIGGLPSWGEIYHIIHPEELNADFFENKTKKKKPFWKR
ncbi:MAG TPA: hydrolase [Prolixibacteraceae bacterium]|nr:hydrolase [Prolixibacteraceae bacterium]HPR59762.1 hydrolase [Prolixibacteraceae bacterium]